MPKKPSRNKEIKPLPKSDNVEYFKTKEPLFEFNPEVLAGHEWKQQGPFLICKGCELDHSLYIGIDKKLEGFDKKGSPILKKR